MDHDNQSISQYDELLRLVTSESEQGGTMLSRLTQDERRAFLYECRTVPLLVDLDPTNRIPLAPFPKSKMKRLLKSAAHKITGWTLDRIINDAPEDRQEGGGNERA